MKFQVMNQDDSYGLKKIKRQGERQDEPWLPNDKSVVCSKHFLPKDYKEGTKIKKLIHDAVPTVFDPFIHKVKLTKPRKPMVKHKVRRKELLVPEVVFQCDAILKDVDETVELKKRELPKSKDVEVQTMLLSRDINNNKTAISLATTKLSRAKHQLRSLKRQNEIIRLENDHLKRLNKKIKILSGSR
ncbi:hypothetical protein CHUAL_006920 [Chamberlinius hualienensis]